MVQQEVKPTRTELIAIKRKIALYNRGYKLLKMKRDGLIGGGIFNDNNVDDGRLTMESIKEAIGKIGKI